MTLSSVNELSEIVGDLLNEKEDMSQATFNTPKIFIINVGVNASHRTLKSPIFDDLTFRFIPIPERYKEYDLPTYKEIFLQDTLKYIPRKYHNWKAHNDPEFLSFTYGDYPIRRGGVPNPRVANLKYAEKGDWIFFFARLVKWRDGKFINEAGFYFIGYFEIDYILKGEDVPKLLHSNLLNDFKNNAHIVRITRAQMEPDSYWIFKGNKNSKLFNSAVPFTREFADRVMRDAEGNPWKWDDGKSPLQIIGSYARTCKIIQNENEVNCFWGWINKHISSIRKGND